MQSPFIQSTVPVEKAFVSESPPLEDFFVAHELSSNLLRDAGEQQKSIKFPVVPTF